MAAWFLARRRRWWEREMPGIVKAVIASVRMLR